MKAKVIEDADEVTYVVPGVGTGSRHRVRDLGWHQRGRTACHPPGLHPLPQVSN